MEDIIYQNNIEIANFLKKLPDACNHIVIKNNWLDDVLKIINKINFYGKSVCEYGVGGGHLFKIVSRLGIKSFVGIDLNDKIVENNRVFCKNLLECNNRGYMWWKDVVGCDIFLSFATIQQFPNLEYMECFFHNINEACFDTVAFNVRIAGRNVFRNNIGIKEIFQKNNYLTEKYVMDKMNSYELIFKSRINKQNNYVFFIFKKKRVEESRVEDRDVGANDNRVGVSGGFDMPLSNRVYKFIQYIQDTLKNELFFKDSRGASVGNVFGGRDNRIVLVGNSPCLLGKRLGEVIDGMDVVVRFNDWITKGFEGDVGKKTTHWASCCSVQTQLKRRKFEDKFMFLSVINTLGLSIAKRNELIGTRMGMDYKDFIHLDNDLFYQACRIILKYKLTTGTIIILVLLLMGYTDINICGMNLEYKNGKQRYFKGRNLYIDHDVSIDKEIIHWCIAQEFIKRID